MDKKAAAERKEKEEKYYEEHRSELAQGDKNAAIRYEKYFSLDPFPEIAEALLNSADIFKYVAKTGMIFPFYPEDLSGASYEVRIKGPVVWWEKENAEKQTRNLEKEGDYFDLQPNSIAFVTLEPSFRIPDYMALRFNLKISHVYKGLLLGTGPLVDPGFVGKLSIPLHNLTSNTYRFKFNDGIIQMEFTKLSNNSCWMNKEQPRNSDGQYKRKWIKPDRTMEYYIKRALMSGELIHDSVQSSIPKEIAEVKKQVDESADMMQLHTEQMNRKFKAYKISVDKSIKNNQTISLAAIIAIATLVVATLAFALTTIHQYKTIDASGWEDINKLRIEHSQLEESYKDEIERLNSRILELERIISIKEMDDVNAGEN